MKKYFEPSLSMHCFYTCDIVLASSFGNDNDGEDINDWYNTL